jgi:predicted glycoside hydrolase/deacetylase ChbG (UPF0249 family)
MVKLIVNGDDFGLCSGVNKGIIRLCERGVLTSATIMVNQSGTKEALEFASRTPWLGLGVHLNLTTGRPLLPPDRVPTLVDEAGFFFSPSRLVGRISTGQTDKGDILRELGAQIEFCYGEGLRLTHLDTHSLTHAFPPLGSLVLQLTRRYEIPAIRSPTVSGAVAPYACKWMQRIGHWFGRPVARSQTETKSARGKGAAITWNGLKTTHYLLYLRWWLGDRCFEDLEGTLRVLGDRAVEIMAHPGFLDNELAALSNYVEGREEEVRVLSSQRFDELLDRLGAVLTNFGGL